MSGIPEDLKERARWEIKFFERPSVETSKLLLERVEEMESFLSIYNRLHDGLSDMIKSGRLKESDVPDDYKWLANLLAGDELCQDEGCPHHGTAHICINQSPPD